MHSHLDLATKAWKSIRDCIKPYSEPLSARSMPQLEKQTTAIWEIPTMSAATASTRDARRPDVPRNQSQAASDATLEIEELEDEELEDGSGPEDAPPRKPTPGAQPTPAAEDSEREGRPKSPAYIAPIGKIPPISPISPAAGIEPPRDRLQLPEYIGRFLVGKKVNADGEIVDGESQQILGRAGGDLPSLVGLSVSNARGDILDDNGVCVGWVEDLELGRPRGMPAAARSPKSLFELLGQRTAGLMVDGHNNLLDPVTGQILGTYFDNKNPEHRKEKEEREARTAQARKQQCTGQPEQDRSSPGPPDSDPTQRGRDPAGGEGEDETAAPRARRSESERRRNAQSWRKENPGESPSDIFLDVKSTTEGIQLTIRIPTVFGGQQLKPNISFS